MSKIIPLGYRETRMGRDMAVFLMIFAGILSVTLVTSGMEIGYTAYLFAGAAVLAALFILSDITSNKKNKEKIAYMQKMLACPYVLSSVVEIKKYYKGLGGKPKEIRPGGIITYKEKDCVYRIVASFPKEDGEILVESELYVNNPKRFLKNDSVRIFYSEDEEYWIDVND